MAETPFLTGKIKRYAIYGSLLCEYYQYCQNDRLNFESVEP